MKVVINGLGVTSGGGLVSFRELLPELRSANPEIDYVVLLSRGQRELANIVPHGMSVRIAGLSRRSVALRILYEQLVVPWILWSIGADWLYSPGNQTVLLAPCKTYLLMENTNPYSHLELGWGLRERMRLMLLRFLGRLSVWRATHIRFLTNNSRAVIASRLGIPAKKTSVIPHGVTMRAPQAGRRSDERVLPPAGPFVLTVSNIAPHKNLECLLKGFDLFAKETAFAGKLVIAGGFLYSDYFNNLQGLLERLSSRDKILFVGWMDPDALGRMYLGAEMFVFPSLEESFGMPVIEAMGYGVPVLVSRPPQDDKAWFIPFEELCGDAGLYFDPFDPSDLANQMVRLHQQDDLRSRLIERGKARAIEYSWTRTANELIRDWTTA